MSNRRPISAIAESVQIPKPLLAFNTVILAVAVAALFFTFSIQLSPCTGTAQAAQCDIGDDEVLTGSTTFEGDVTLEDELNVGATPGPGSSWNVIASQGASTSPEWVEVARYKTADETVNADDTLQDDDDFSWSVVANGTYLVHGALLINTGTTPDFKFQWSLPASATIDGVILQDHDGSGTGNTNSFTEASADEIPGRGQDQVHSFEAVLNIAGTAGSATLQWAQNTSDGSNTTVLEGSWISLRRIN